MDVVQGTEERAAEVRHYVERLALVLTQMGLPAMPARVWVAALLADGDTVTAGEIGARLDVSPAAVSGAVQYLLQIDLLTRAAAPGSRRQHFRANSDQWADSFLSRQRGLHEFASIAGEGVALLGPDTTAGARVAEIRDFFEYLAEEMPRLLENWLAQRRG
jgi:hypothetical protein